MRYNDDLLERKLVREILIVFFCSSQVAEARREAEEKRDAKYAKMERQREEIRQGIREKVYRTHGGEKDRID